MKKPRNETRKVKAGNLQIGGDAPVSIQSMTNIPIDNVKATIRQINDLNAEGADLVRLAVRNEESIRYLKEIRREISTPLSADIHFNYKIAIKAIEAGIDKVRINPGNIGDAGRVKEVVKAAKERSVPIRIGVNGGSVDLKKYPSVTPETLVESALDNIRTLEDNDFTDIVVSIKSSDIFQTIEANEIFSETRNYPLHIGLTESGYGLSCTVQSSVVIGHLLLNGIGDTVRVSMTGDPVEEIKIAKKILESVGERKALLRIISCPTCGRTDPSLNLEEIAMETEIELNRKFGERLAELDRNITIAVMGCEVNGPGEASHADLGIAGARGGQMVLFAHGRKIGKIYAGEAVEALAKEMDDILNKK